MFCQEAETSHLINNKPRRRWLGPLLSRQAIALCDFAAGGVFFIHFKNISKMRNHREKDLTVQAQREYICLPEGVQVRRKELIALQKLISFIEQDFETRWDHQPVHNLPQHLAQLAGQEVQSNAFILDLQVLLNALFIGEKGRMHAKPGSSKVRRGAITAVTTTHVQAWHKFKNKVAPDHPANELFRFICENFLPTEASTINDLVCLHEYLMLLKPVRNSEVM